MDVKNKKILVVGASSDLASKVNRVLFDGKAKLGLHFCRNRQPLEIYPEGPQVKKLQKDLNSAAACRELVDEFAAWAGGIDCLIQLCGDIHRPVNWQQLEESDWDHDLGVNLKAPFFLVQQAVPKMKAGGGRIILVSTASASHGGGSTSLAYGVAKAGIECLVKGLARDCAPHNILVNAIAPGFILTKFHTQRMQRSEAQLARRVEFIPLGRPGTADEFAASVMFLLSESSAYVTGQIIALSGGDWI